MLTATAKSRLYRQMLLIRRIEERVAEMYGEQLIGGFEAAHWYNPIARNWSPSLV